MLKDFHPAPLAKSVARIAEHVALRLEALPIQCLWQLRALYEGAPVGLAFVDRDLRYLVPDAVRDLILATGCYAQQ